MLEEEDESHHTKSNCIERSGIFASSRCMAEDAAAEDAALEVSWC